MPDINWRLQLFKEVGMPRHDNRRSTRKSRQL